MIEPILIRRALGKTHCLGPNTVSACCSLSIQGIIEDMTSRRLHEMSGISASNLAGSVGQEMPIGNSESNSIISMKDIYHEYQMYIGKAVWGKMVHGYVFKVNAHLGEKPWLYEVFLFSGWLFLLIRQSQVVASDGLGIWRPYMRFRTQSRLKSINIE